MSVLADFGCSIANPSTVVTRFTTINYFPRPSTTGTPLTAPYVYNPNNPQPIAPVGTPTVMNATGQLNYPAGILNGQLARIQLAGVISSNIAVNATIVLAANTGTLSSPNYFFIAGTGLVAVGGTGSVPLVSIPWSLEAIVSGDSYSGKFSGQYSAMANGAYHNTSGATPWILLDNNLTGINFNPAPGQAGVNTYPFGLVVAITFGTGSVANQAQLTQFRIVDF